MNPAMRAFNLTSLFVFSILVANMSCHECVSGTFFYKAKIRFVDENGTPLDGIRVIVNDYDDYEVFDNVHCDCCDDDYCRTTDDDGFATVVSPYEEGDYGYCSPDKAPDPPPIRKKLYLWIEYPEDNWVMYEMSVADDMIEKEEGRFFVDLGTITINTNLDTDTNDTASDSDQSLDGGL